MTIDEALELLDPRLARLTPTGLEPHPHDIPHDVLEDAMRTFLGKIAARQRARSAGPPGARYCSSEELLLAVASPVRADVLTMTINARPSRQCFTNAYAISQEGLYLYTEGFALISGAAEPFHHAWLTGPRGEIEDPTWVGMLAAKRSAQPSRDWPGTTVYLGVTIGAADHAAWTARREYPNLLCVYDDDIPETLLRGVDAFAATRPMSDAPRDGTEIIGVYADPIGEQRIAWWFGWHDPLEPEGALWREARVGGLVMDEPLGWKPVQ